VSGTDSPYRETANITDGSSFTADMAVHNFVGDAFRGATWVSLHNGGGVGWGEVINGGFGLVLDGSQVIWNNTVNGKAIRRIQEENPNFFIFPFTVIMNKFYEFRMPNDVYE
jgi:urocanate hydratase